MKFFCRIIPVLLLFVSFFPGASYGEPEHLKQGIADFRDESFEEAIDNLSKARALDGSSFDAAYWLGMSYLKIEDFKAARTNLADAVRLSPDNMDARLSYAEALYRLNEFDASASELAAIEAAEGQRTGDFYFLKGLVLSKAGKNNEAIDAFKKAKEQDIRLSQAADYQAGLVHMKENRFSEAKAAFKEVVVKDPATDLALYADEYGKAIAKREERERPFSLSVGFRYEYDDNVILKPYDASAATGITNQGDDRKAWTLRAGFAPRLGGRWSLKADYSLYIADQTRLNGYDMTTHTLSLTPGMGLKKGSVNAALSYGKTTVFGSDYLESYGIAPSYNMTAGKGMATISLRAQMKNFAQPPVSKPEDRDSVDIAAGAGFFSPFMKDKGFYSMRYEANKEDTKGDNWTYTGHKGSAGVFFPLDAGIKLKGYIEANQQSYGNVNTYFGKKRKDLTFTKSLLISYAIFTKTELIAQYTHIKDNSNIDVYEYERNIISAGIEFKL
ncbi:MAG: tetratricopeptide repeat protein [Deltaproteobacteria bacterium]|nr:tetratricopeptide repeat protein [Deltaproteobacteria bacterium]